MFSVLAIVSSTSAISLASSSSQIAERSTTIYPAALSRLTVSPNPRALTPGALSDPDFPIPFFFLRSPSTLAQTTDTLFSLLEVLLQSRSLDTAEELAIVLALASSSSANLTRIEALCARLGLPPMWEELPLEPETHVTMLFVAFVAGPVLASGTEKTEAFQLLARAAEETPRALEPS